MIKCFFLDAISPAFPSTKMDINSAIQRCCKANKDSHRSKLKRESSVFLKRRDSYWKGILLLLQAAMKMHEHKVVSIMETCKLFVYKFDLNYLLSTEFLCWHVIYIRVSASHHFLLCGDLHPWSLGLPPAWWADSSASDSPARDDRFLSRSSVSLINPLTLSNSRLTDWAWGLYPMEPFPCKNHRALG